MSAPNAGILDTVLNTFRTNIDSGFGALQGPVNGTLGSLIVISVVSMALMWAIDDGGQIWGPLIRKAMTVGFWSYMILNWQTMALAVYTAFGNLGATAGGASGLSGFLNSPSQIVALGIKNAQTLIDLAAYYFGNTNQWGTPPQAAAGFDINAALGAFLHEVIFALEAIICALIVFIGYFWLALEVVVTTIEFHIVILMGFCLLPFGVFERTSSYAERVLGYVISAGFKVMALGIVIALGTTYLTNTQLTYTPGSLPGLDVMTGDALEILILLMLALSAPKYAQAVVSGGTTTGVGSLAGAAGLVAGAGLLAGGVLKAAGGAISGLAGAAGGVGGAIANAAAASASVPGGSPGAQDATAASAQSAAAQDAPGAAPGASQPPKGPGLASAINPAGTARKDGGDSAPAAGLADAVSESAPGAAGDASRSAPNSGAQTSGAQTSGAGDVAPPPAQRQAAFLAEAQTRANFRPDASSGADPSVASDFTGAASAFAPAIDTGGAVAAGLAQAVAAPSAQSAPLAGPGAGSLASVVASPRPAAAPAAPLSWSEREGIAYGGDWTVDGATPVSASAPSSPAASPQSAPSLAPQGVATPSAAAQGAPAQGGGGAISTPSAAPPSWSDREGITYGGDGTVAGAPVASAPPPSGPAASAPSAPNPAPQSAAVSSAAPQGAPAQGGGGSTPSAAPPSWSDREGITYGGDGTVAGAPVASTPASSGPGVSSAAPASAAPQSSPSASAPPPASPPAWSLPAPPPLAATISQGLARSASEVGAPASPPPPRPAEPPPSDTNS